MGRADREEAVNALRFSDGGREAFLGGGSRIGNDREVQGPGSRAGQSGVYSKGGNAGVRWG